MAITDWIQIILMGLLVVVTGIYAWRTFAISKATQKQADEMKKEQRYSECLPLLVPDITRRKITTVQAFRIDEKNKRAFLGELYFTVDGRRLGKEVARRD